MRKSGHPGLAPGVRTVGLAVRLPGRGSSGPSRPRAVSSGPVTGHRPDRRVRGLPGESAGQLAVVLQGPGRWNASSNVKSVLDVCGGLGRRRGAAFPMCWKSEQYRRTGWIDFFDRPWLVDLVHDLFTTPIPTISEDCPRFSMWNPLNRRRHFGLRSAPRARPLLSGVRPAVQATVSRPGPPSAPDRGDCGPRAFELIDMGKGPECCKQTPL